jgi:hypothetical protein
MTRRGNRGAGASRALVAAVTAQLTAIEERLVERLEAAALRGQEGMAAMDARTKKLARVAWSSTTKTERLLDRLADRLEQVERILDAGTIVDSERLARELALAAQWRRRAVVEVRQPLVLISEIGRSGGTLLGRLLTSHPQCHTYPQRLEFGLPNTSGWPAISLEGDADLDGWWDTLRNLPGENDDDLQGRPLLFVPALARQLFEDVLRSRPVESARDVLDAYMTAYFNAWLDNQNLYGEDKRWVVASAPGLAVKPGRREHFFADYPDGRLVCIVREPKHWFVAARRAPGSVGLDSFPEPDPATLIELWRASTQGAVAAKREYGEQVLLVSFERLVRYTRETLAAITSFLEIELPEVALVSTSDGSLGFEAEHDTFPAERATTLEPEIAAQIDELTAEDYRTVLDVAKGRQRAAVPGRGR